METLNLYLVFLSGIFIGCSVIYLYLKSKTISRNIYEDLNNSHIRTCSDNENIKSKLLEIEKERNEQIYRISKLLDEKKILEIELSKKNIENDNLDKKNREQKEELVQLQTKLIKEFENLANKILNENSSKFTVQNKENIQNILSPLQEKIQLFEKKVEDSQKENIGIHASLREELKHLQEQSTKISKEANDLTKALKSDTKTQGNWGELILERVLEKSGLRKDEDYLVQQTFEDPNNESKKVRPDVIVRLSDDKNMIIDSKVSLTYYERYINEEDTTLKERYIKEHINSIRKHIEELSAKKYHEINTIETLDFVLLFIPNDPAFAYALNYDHALWEKAFEKNIIIVTPITILSTLKTINSLWNIQKRQENAEEIARLAGTLYDKFIGFYENLENIGKRLEQVHKEYSDAKRKLYGHGSAIKTIEKLKKMGAKTQKSIPDRLLNQIDEIEYSEDVKYIGLSEK